MMKKFEIKVGDKIVTVEGRNKFDAATNAVDSNLILKDSIEELEITEVERSE